MPRRLVTLPRTPGMALDIVSYGRRGPLAAGRLTGAQVAQVERTVRRVPEVVVKVSGGARERAGVLAHLKYIDRHGRLPIETDDGRRLEGREAAPSLTEEWALELCAGAHRPRPADGQPDRRPKLVHNIVLSMPGRTPPEAVLAAARNFARENFALQYRYAMVLHTDQAHPHVHLVVKAEHEFEPRQRLVIRKSTLRDWREQFAAFLREEGVAANATPRPLRGQTEAAKKDAVHHRLRDLAAYRALSPQERIERAPPVASTFMRIKVEAIARTLGAPADGAEVSARHALADSRQQVMADWSATAAILRRQGLGGLAAEVERFAADLPAVQTERERIARCLADVLRASREARTRGRDR